MAFRADLFFLSWPEILVKLIANDLWRVTVFFNFVNPGCIFFIWCRIATACWIVLSEQRILNCIYHTFSSDKLIFWAQVVSKLICHIQQHTGIWQMSYRDPPFHWYLHHWICGYIMSKNMLQTTEQLIGGDENILLFQQHKSTVG